VKALRPQGVAVWTLLIGAIGSGLVSAANAAQKNDERKLSDAERRDGQTVVRMIEDAVAGRPAASDLGLEWIHEDFLKADDRKTYVAFTVSVDVRDSAGRSAALSVRVLKAGTSATVVDQGASFVGANLAGPTARVSRSFVVPAGIYDVFVAVKAPGGGATLKRTITVPDFWSGELTTSSVIVVQRIEALAAPLTHGEQATRPYVLGTVELVPAWDARVGRKSELQTFFLIYNPTIDSANKPDITVDYWFYTVAGGASKLFARTKPVTLNGRTLPRFDLGAGDQLQAGRSVPLASFPEGEYRLEIRITDKISNKSLTREVNFTVTPS
jgi:hypothetical protein